MGVYDTLTSGARSGQVKLWGDQMNFYGIGDSVPPYNGHRTYDIAMREGGFAHIKDLFFVGWDGARWKQVPCFDKWGGLYLGPHENRGYLGEDYRFDYRKE